MYCNLLHQQIEHASTGKSRSWIAQSKVRFPFTSREFGWWMIQSHHDDWVKISALTRLYWFFLPCSSISSSMVNWSVATTPEKQAVGLCTTRNKVRQNLYPKIHNTYMDLGDKQAFGRCASDGEKRIKICTANHLWIRMSTTHLNSSCAYI